MIKGINQEFFPRERVLSGAKPEKESSFAKELGGQSPALKGESRNERADKPGREIRSEADREGVRSTERDSSSRQQDVKKRQKRSADDNALSAQQDPRAPQIQRAPVGKDEAQTEMQSGAIKPDVPPAIKGAPAPRASNAGGAGGAAVSGVQSAAGPAGSSVVTDEVLQTLQQLQGEQSQVKNEAMETFLMRMQAELGVPPEKILQAFAKLDDQAMLAPPEVTMVQFLDNLSLQPGQQSKAAELYQEMVWKTGEAELNKRLIGMESGVNFEVLSPKEQALRKINQALDQMNEIFFMKDQMQPVPMKNQLAAESMEAQLAQLQNGKAMAMTPENAQATDESGRSGEKASVLSTGFLGAAGAAATTASLAMAANSSTGGMQPRSPDLDDLDLDKELQAIDPSFGSQTPDVTSMNSEFPLEVAEQPALNVSKNPAAQVTPDQGRMAGAQAQQAGGGKSGAARAASDGSTKAEALKAPSAELSSLGTPAAGTPTAPAATAAASTPAAMMMGRPQPTEQDEQANIKEMIRQAQLVLKRGGGEMTMDLKPEGLGQVKLKVSVDGGQVNVQMVTENDAAKKMLEKGLHELRASLAAQELKVENMKVDMGTEIRKQMDSNPDLAREQARQFAGDFLGQFRDERQAMRQGFFDNSGMRGYRAEPKNRNGTNDDAAQGIVASSKRNQGSNKRLDLVA